MSGRSFAQVRADVATRIELLSGWWEAPVVADLFGPSLVPDAIPAPKGHLAFAVRLQTTTTTGDRQRPGVGMWVRSVIEIRFLARLPPKGQVGGYDAGLAAEVALIAHLIAAGWPPTWQIAYDSSDRTAATTGEWVLHTVRFFAYHRLDT